MAPSATYDYPTYPSGGALEAISDAVDEVNVLKAHAAEVKAQREAEFEFDSQSKFDSTKDKKAFRQYEDACDRVKNFYAEQHAKQTVAYNLAARQRFHSKSRVRPEMTVWEAMEKLNTLIDESDPDTSLSQIQHLLQSAEAIRRDGKPRWMQITGLVHDLGKLMLFFEGAQGQWDVVGDTFPVGCRFDDRCIYHEAFAKNPDAGHEVFGDKYGIYQEACGMENLIMSWGHDEYLYLVLRDQSLLPREALAMIRFHSFYPWHHEGAYSHFMAEGDEELLSAVRAFNPYDLYSKSDGVPSVEELKPYYMELIDEFFPQKKIKW
ncbi:inositol oxygenase-like protein [Bombardia bombarda]|uniref:Inositol oxygenase n=1 Tax=Bombardia bombarda TaxID=252184 RepID=A0AA39WBC3_9PEZI|nr:inositol oxygenase-like protein [Bombardia bombarda]